MVSAFLTSFISKIQNPERIKLIAAVILEPVCKLKSVSNGSDLLWYT